MKKSKLMMFLLSFIPGLSHLYLGFANRAAIFSIAFFGVILVTGGLCVLVDHSGPLAISFFILPLIWLVGLIDAFSLRDKALEQQVLESSNPNVKPLLAESNHKAITMMLSIIPGAGHMYLGLINKGLAFMSAFFFSIFFMGWLGFSVLLFIIPVIWFYSFFDAFHLADEKNPKDDAFTLPFLDIHTINHKWIGWILIGIGVLVVFERVLSPLIDYRIYRHLKTFIVAIIFIIGGIKMLKTNKVSKEDDVWEKE